MLWKKVSVLTGINPTRGEFKNAFILWLATTIFFFAILLGVGKLIFLEWTGAGFYLILMLASGFVMKRNFKFIRLD